MGSNFDAVVAFQQQAYGLLPDRLALPTKEEIALRMRLVQEEYSELLVELGSAYVARDAQDDGHGLLKSFSYAKLAGELVDLVYVVLGTAAAFGIPFDECFAAVHRANMAKFAGGPRFSETGKLLKPEGWRPADLGLIVAANLDG